MDIRRYLVDVAEEITARAPELPDKAEFHAWQDERRELFREMLGIRHHFSETREAPSLDVTRVLERETYRIECLSYESLPGMRVEANLYIPKDPGPHPGLLYVCGHAALQKAAHYHLHARRYAELGFVTLIVDTIQLGEVRGYHHGTHRYGWFNWYSRGYTPAGVETWNGIRGLDLLSARSDVDANRLGVTGTSGGGGMSWWIAAADPRVAVSSPSCGTTTIASYVRDRTIDGHCDCMTPINFQGSSLVDMAALIAPRPVLIVSPDRDELFPIASVEDFHRRLMRVYEHLGQPQNLELFTFRGPHSYSESSRRTTFQWMVRHLQGKDVAYEDVDDVDSDEDAPEALRVYTAGLPANNRSTTVHDWFVPRAAPPEIDTVEDVKEERARVVRALRARTFATFPDPLPDPQPAPAREWLDRSGTNGQAFTFATERGWRLEGALRIPPGAAPNSPTIVNVMGPSDTRWIDAYARVGGAPEDWIVGALAPRGTGETSWNSAFQWHLRRAAMVTGRSLASLRVLDTLQGLRALRQLPGARTERVYLAAQGEMAAVALYAALLDGFVDGLILFDPPATQDTAGAPDGTGPCLEMLGCLQVTDLPYIAGLLWPMELIFIGGRPATYQWAEDLYTRLGAPGAWWNVAELAHWHE